MTGRVVATVLTRSPAGARAGRRGRVRPAPCSAPVVVNPAQLAVPGWTEWVSSAWTRSTPGAPAARCSTMDSRSCLGEPARRGRDTRARRRPRPRPTRAASSTASAILARTRWRPDGGGLDQPGVRPGPQGQERLLPRGGRPRGRRARPAVRVLRVVGIVAQIDPGPPRGGQTVPGDLDQADRAVGGRPGRADRQGAQVGDDDEFVAVGAHPHLRADQPGRGGVAHRPEPDCLVAVHRPGRAQRQGVRARRQGVQPGPLDIQRRSLASGRSRGAPDR